MGQVRKPVLRLHHDELIVAKFVGVEEAIAA